MHLFIFCTIPLKKQDGCFELFPLQEIIVAWLAYLDDGGTPSPISQLI